MTIIGLFRRYQRWNPVHPTYGAFWGLGIGLGCGVGWGPGFGPETVGFVGGGCGLGFSVGLTFIGFGIGLPANGLTCLPYNALTCITNETFNLARGAAPVMVNAGNQGLTCISHKATEMQKNVLSGVRSIECSHLAAFSSSVISGIKGSWLAMGIALRDLELRFRNPSSQPLKPINSKGQEKSV
ncbi:hypothetical protein KP509_12G058800 [Ceratopteris richardii]|uniref:Cadmium-induced protein AS8 n=1 Tax=Ceratopteris richardii TaxID=49495 RepID=A0A8T2TQ19_CERRI|nr:hypothetical protein KP509_12G058800 [Ceratopteris richardii]